jgi:hypothetical protein
MKIEKVEVYKVGGKFFESYEDAKRHFFIRSVYNVLMDFVKDKVEEDDANLKRYAVSFIKLISQNYERIYLDLTKVLRGDSIDIDLINKIKIESGETQ